MSAERTPKPLKALQLVGFLMIFVGVVARAGAGEYWGSFLAFTGFVVWALGKALAWWRAG